MDTKTEIFTTARELFYAKGFKDTNVSDIAKLAGIGVGTFYNYYSSKEQLFLEIYLKENMDLKMRLMESVDLNADPVSFVTRFIAQNITDMDSNRILREWYNKELFSKLEQHFDEQGGTKSIAELMQGGMVELIKKWKAEGKIRADLDDEIIQAIFNAIPYIELHKREIGLQYFPRIMLHITELIMKGLTDCSK